MIICSCNVLSDAKVRASIQAETGPRTAGAVYRCFGCSPNCGRCVATVRSLIVEALSESQNSTDGNACCDAMSTLP
ncbi:MAG TPA: (2Fe-2S)-binding protein [Methylovirgula sp.]